MRTITRSHHVLTASMVLLLAAASPSLALDTISLRSRGNVRGQIKRITPDKITIDVKGSLDELSVGDIRNVTFSDEPAELRDARSRILSGDFLEAIGLLKKIDLTKLGDTDKFVKQDIQFFYANCFAQRAMGGAEAFEEAGKLMIRFVENNDDSYHYFEANEIIGDLLVEMGNPDKAEEFYITAEKAPWPEAKLRIALARARALQAQNKHDKAIAEFDKVLNGGMQSDLSDRLRLAANLGKAASLARSKQGDAGIKLVNEVIKSADKEDTEIHARAYNALGDCNMAMGQAKAAAMAYLHVEVLYNQHPSLHAEALSRLAAVWDRLEMPDRAATARKKLISLYPNSKWAKQPS